MTSGLQDSTPGRDHDDCKTKSPGIPVRSTEDSERTLMHVSATYERDVTDGSETERKVITMRSLRTNDFEDPLARTCAYSDLLAMRD